MNISRRFYKYVSQNILGTIGISLYVLADTFFIAQAGGANGITILNLALPIISLVFALAAMIGIGAATEFAILKAQGDQRMYRCFSNAVIWQVLISAVFVLVGLLFPEEVLQLMGGDQVIATQGASYMRLFLAFTPLFMVNTTITAFVRNDDNPTLAMVATLLSTLFNIVFDYIFVFPMKMGITGAALATVVSPVISILICLLHFRRARTERCLRWKWFKPSFKQLFKASQLGFSAFVSEMSNGITVMVFNFLILAIAGNIGVAAYGIVANIAIVVTAIYNGIAQGSQPLISESYGKGDRKSVKKLLRLCVVSSLVSSAVLYGILFGFTDLWVAMFNSENSLEMAMYAKEGVRLYFLGSFFAGFNIVAIGLLSAIERVKGAFVASMLRGFVAIIAFALVMAHFFAFTGVWLSFLAAEAFTAVFAIVFLHTAIREKATS